MHSTKAALEGRIRQLAFAVLAGLFFVLPPCPAAAGGSTSELETALIRCDVEALGDALSRGASANWVHPESGETALHYAVQCESGRDGTQYGLVRMLVAAGAVVSLDAFSGESVLERALLFGSEPTIALLLESGADPNSMATMGVSMPALARIVGNEGAERALRMYGGELLASDLEAIEQWDWIPDFVRSTDHWMDSNPDADSDGYEEALGQLRHYLEDQPELVAELDLELDQLERSPTVFRQDDQCCGSGLAPTTPYAVDRAEGQVGLSHSECRENCHGGYRGSVKGCGDGVFGIACRVNCGWKREGCLDNCGKLRPQDPPQR